MIEKEFSQQTQILTVYFVCISVHLKHRQRIFTIDLVSRWVSQSAFIHMSLQYTLTLHILETKLTYVQLRKSIINNRHITWSAIITRVQCYISVCREVRQWIGRWVPFPMNMACQYQGVIFLCIGNSQLCLQRKLTTMGT